MNRAETIPSHEHVHTPAGQVLDARQAERTKWLDALTSGNFLAGFGVGGLLGLDAESDKSFFLGMSITALAVGALFMSAPYLDEFITKKLKEQKQNKHHQ